MEVLSNYEEAARWYLKSAEQGYANAQTKLGIMYYKGQGIALNDQEAIKWFQKAAEQGHAEAQTYLGKMHIMGHGVTKNQKEAARWWQKAAEQGYAQAQYNLGSIYASGRGVTQSGEEAIKWYQKAAEQGHTDAQRSLRIEQMQQGLVVPSSFSEAMEKYSMPSVEEMLIWNPKAYKKNIKGVYFLGFYAGGIPGASFSVQVRDRKDVGFFNVLVSEDTVMFSKPPVHISIVRVLGEFIGSKPYKTKTGEIRYMAVIRAEYIDYAPL